MAEGQEGAPPAPSDEQARFDAETKTFAAPKVVQAEWASDRNAVLGNAQPSVEGAADGSDGAVGDASGEVGDDAEGKPPAAEVDGAGSGAKDGEAEAAEGGQKEVVPAWLTERTTRLTAKEHKIEAQAETLRQREQEIADREAAIEARDKAAALKKPDPDEFDDVADYDAAKDAYDAAQKAARDAAAKAKKPTEKPAAAAPNALPLGLTEQDMADAFERITSAVSPALVEKLAAKGVVLPHVVMVEISEASSKEEIDRMSRFVLQNQETMKAIAKLPARQQASALVKAYAQKPPAEGKKRSDAPDPISPAGGPSGVKAGLAQMSYADFEKEMDKAEIEARKAGRPFQYG